MLHHFNPRFPRGKRHHDLYMRRPGRCISIHASRGGSDHMNLMNTARHSYFNPRFPRGKRLQTKKPPSGLNLFQSTLPAGEATSPDGAMGSKSTHFNPRFPRGKRRQLWGNTPQNSNFNPRFPRGKRPPAPYQKALMESFQSTLPAGEATK